MLKRILSLLILIGIANAGLITERVYFTPSANGQYLSANMIIVGSTNTVSANKLNGIVINAGSKGLTVNSIINTITLNVTAINAGNASLLAGARIEVASKANNTLGINPELSLNNSGVAGYLSQLGLGYARYGANMPAVIGFTQRSNSGGGYGDILFATRAVNTDTAPTERMRLTGEGNVSIGTAYTADYDSTTPRLKVSSSAANLQAITVAGGSPISGWTADSHSGAIRFGSWNINGDIAYDADGTNGFHIRDNWSSNGKVVLGVGATSVLYVRDTNGGNVGIRVVAPSTALEVAGTVSANLITGSGVYGTYVPTLYNTTSINVTAVTFGTTMWSRVGNMVTVAGSVSITQRTTLLLSRISITLPIPSTFTSIYDASGVASLSPSGIISVGAGILANNGYTYVVMDWSGYPGTANDVWNYRFSYIVK